MYLGEGKYIYSFGKIYGCNGIGIDFFIDLMDFISYKYF